MKHYLSTNQINLIYLLIFFLVLAWSAWAPKGYFIWILEVLPALIGLVLVIYFYPKFKFSQFAYFFLLIHAIILMIGGHYTYADVPFFDYLKELFLWDRNNYDKVGHFAQGFIPAIIAREIILRCKIIEHQPFWLNFFAVCICLSFSALYEIFEWWVAVLTGTAADDFLGTQGYIWDTQADMLYCLMGALTMVLLFSSIHNRSIAKVLSPSRVSHDN